MDEFDFEELGDRISDLIESAVNSKNFQMLNETITDAVNTAIDSGATALKDAMNGKNAYKRNRYQVPEEFQKKREKPKEKKEDPTKHLYADVSGDQVKGILAAAGGAILTGWNAIALMAGGAISALARGGGAFGMIVTGLFMAAGIGLFAWGRSILGRAKRFKRYKQELGQNTYIDLDRLTQISNKPVKFVRKDCKKMIARGWFREGRLDLEEKTLITSKETYNQYLETQKEVQAQKIREARERAKEPVITPEVQDVLDKGQEYLDEIHRCNDAIPGAEMTAKIAQIEEIVREILNRARTHPEVVSDLKKLMNYYLPMTIKLLKAYEEMDRQPIQGDNIKKSKKEIEDTLDTLHKAFENLLDSVFAETALDVSTDISVLNTILAQEGLKEDELQVAMRH